jgi:hypothetical protein
MTLFFGIFVIGVYVLNSFLIQGIKKVEAYEYGFWNKILGGEINAEIIVSGSSRALVQFDCRIISQATGKSCFNMGLDGSQMNFQLPLVQSYFLYNQGPKIFIQVVGIDDLSTGEIYEPYQYLPYLDEK